MPCHHMNMGYVGLLSSCCFHFFIRPPHQVHAMDMNAWRSTRVTHGELQRTGRIHRKDGKRQVLCHKCDKCHDHHKSKCWMKEMRLSKIIFYARYSIIGSRSCLRFASGHHKTSPSPLTAVRPRGVDLSKATSPTLMPPYGDSSRLTCILLLSLYCHVIHDWLNRQKRWKNKKMTKGPNRGKQVASQWETAHWAARNNMSTTRKEHHVVSRNKKGLRGKS